MGVEGGGKMFCAHCARESGQGQLRDRGLAAYVSFNGELFRRAYRRDLPRSVSRSKVTFELIR